MTHIRFIVSKTHGVKIILLCDISVSIFDLHKWHVTLNEWNNFYVIRTDGSSRTVYLHREILGFVHGDGKYVDHNNHNGLDNQVSNLRLATNQENGFNRGKNKNNTSGVKGVRWHNKNHMWVAQIKHHGTNYYLGSFETIRGAIKSRNEKAKELHGGFYFEESVDEDFLDAQVKHADFAKTHEERHANRAVSKNNQSGYPGIVWIKSTQNWRARIMFQGISYNVGRFPLIQDAIEARAKKASELHKSETTLVN